MPLLGNFATTASGHAQIKGETLQRTAIAKLQLIPRTTSNSVCAIRLILERFVCQHLTPTKRITSTTEQPTKKVAQKVTGRPVTTFS